MPKEQEANSELEWIKFREETLGDQAFADTQQSKFRSKISQNMFVPIGAAATVAALTVGLYQFKKGNPQKSQMMMRLRIAAQGFTIVAILGGLFLGTRSSEPKK